MIFVRDAIYTLLLQFNEDIILQLENSFTPIYDLLSYDVFIFEFNET